MKTRLWSLVISGLLFLMASCKQESPQTPAAAWPLPMHFPPPVYNFDQNTTTAAGFALGKALFYDPILSRDSTISCASCHLQSHAFADVVAFSQGVDAKRGRRNAPALQNLAWHTSFNLDGGINHLDLQPIAPITDSTEHGETLLGVFEKLRNSETYPQRFQAAFGSSEINDKSFLLAISQFTSRLISASSKYDAVKQGQERFNAEEERGYALFQSHCASCHQEPLFSDFSFRNNGHVSSTQDLGRAAVTGAASDEGKFRVPSLRNIARTAPYMHDGGLLDLEAVVAHYRQPRGSADPAIGNGIVLSAEDKADLIRFLHTLTDWTFLSDPLFSAP